MEEDSEMIIDAHVHITPPEMIRNEYKYRKDEPYYDLLCGSPVNKYTTADDLAVQMGKDGVDRSVVFGFGFRSPGLCKKANDYTIESVAKYPEKFTGFAVVNPNDPDLEAELERCKKGGLLGVGELMPFGQGFDMTSKDVMGPLCRFCEENNWPLLIHINEKVGHDYPGKTPDSICEGAALAENFPGLKIIFAHLGGGLFFYETMPEMKDKLKNVYYDTAAVPFLYDKSIYEGIAGLGLSEKIIFGTDYPILSLKRYKDKIENSSLSPDERERIMGGNIKSLLNG